MEAQKSKTIGRREKRPLSNFERELLQQDEIADQDRIMSEQLWAIAYAMRELLHDSNFVDLLAAEKLEEIPLPLFERVALLK